MAMQVGTGAADDAPMIEMNLTPLIDVLLVLLIMFIITIPVQTHAVKLNLPAAPQTPPPVPRPPVRLDIGLDGHLLWDGAAIDSAELTARLAALAAAADPPEVHLRADAQAAYKHVAAVMASAQRLGVTKIGLVGNERFMDP